MTNFRSITSGAIWALTSVLLLFAALEPVSIPGAAPIIVHAYRSA